MSISHHPSEAVLAAYASGGLADGPGLVVCAHLERCAKCRADLRLLEAVGGALIDDLMPTEMEPDALALALARIERPAPPRASTPVKRAGPDGMVLPGALARRGVGPRRFLAPGIWVAPVPSRSADGWRTYLLRAPAGMAVIDHDHHGAEYTLVLEGALADGDARYDAGDFGEAGPGHKHQPKAEPDAPCICLISGQGGIKARGLWTLAKPYLGV